MYDFRMTSSSCEELDNMLGRFPTSLPNYNSIPRNHSNSHGVYCHCIQHVPKKYF